VQCSGMWSAQQHEERRESSAKRGYSYKWQQARKGFLSKHPLCVQCELVGVVTASTDVDHIVPHRGDKELFWTRSNWQALCHSCHSRKTATEDGGWGNASS
jgi:5-methylcytosine-specific restriction protein A